MALTSVLLFILLFFGVILMCLLRAFYLPDFSWLTFGLYFAP
uniref:Macaca fascicularis brain cDNA clone: QflA-16476, similar to human gamma-aminobutyric acid (GABA) A receptor, alpha 1(GABRA1), mRNA, RefSeq: NM_000806.3 n=1 Tax=Macaca fascicularis TaxID=9541 RepID=I7G519_MACFA|nr:unnamed protein product [Macaca fascicularis]